jgi:hypothetical protein
VTTCLCVMSVYICDGERRMEDWKDKEIEGYRRGQQHRRG